MNSRAELEVLRTDGRPKSLRLVDIHVPKFHLQTPAIFGTTTGSSSKLELSSLSTSSSTPSFSPSSSPTTSGIHSTYPSSPHASWLDLDMDIGYYYIRYYESQCTWTHQIETESVSRDGMAHNP